MSKKRTRRVTPYVRRTVALQGTTSRIEAQLDHASQLAIAWARQWLKAGPAQMEVDVLASGVIRRSLQRYMEHLNDSATDAAQEARAVRSCCSTLAPDKEAQEAAWKRLEAHEKGNPMPTFSEVLYGPDSASRWAAFDARVDELVQQINRQRTATNRPQNKEPKP